MSSQLYVPPALPLRKIPDIHSMESSVGLRASMDAVERGKMSGPCWESKPASLLHITEPSLYTT
jgi:hypothetical protein